MKKKWSFLIPSYRKKVPIIEKKLENYMKKVFTLIAIIFLSTTSINAQNFELGSWNILNLKYNHTEKLSFFGEAQLRSLKFYHNFHYYEYKGGINYKVHKNVGLTLAAGSYQTYREGGNFVTPKNNNEFRLWPQIILFQSIGKVKLNNVIEQNLDLLVMAIAIDLGIDLEFHIHLVKKKMITNLSKLV
ncbi:MAG: DUF2490 domain-containing protein [Bacteroidetes bacterium]|nr:DUF2490 domain-containing protein [Bacteroidota bacterium]